MNYDERTQEIFNRAERLKKQKRKRIIRGITGVGLCAVLLVGLSFSPFMETLFLPNDRVEGNNGAAPSGVQSGLPSVNSGANQGPQSPQGDPSDNLSVKIFEEYYPLINTLEELKDLPQEPEGTEGDGIADSNGSSNIINGASGAEGNAYVETTDNQVAGVIEGDLMKRSDKYIYYLSSHKKTLYGGSFWWTHELSVYSIEGTESKEVASYIIENEDVAMFSTPHTTAYELYLSEDCNTVTVIMDYDVGNSRCTAAVTLNVSDVTNIRQESVNCVSGSYVSSRWADGKLLLVTEFSFNKNVDFSKPSDYIPQAGKKGDMKFIPMKDIIIPQKVTSAYYTLVYVFDGEDVTSHTALLSYGNAANTYVSAQNIYVTRGAYENSEYVTEIARIDYSTGKLLYKGSACVKGRVLNQYSMDEKDGILRVVTTTHEVLRYGIEDDYFDYFDYFALIDYFALSEVDNASLYCVDINTFQTVASLENFAPLGESVRSVRFDGNKVNVCTSILLRDPVFIIDLTDLNNITVKDTGEIGGFSTSLRKFKDNTLLGIGVGDSSLMKIELYKETSDGVVSVASYEGNYGFSEEYKSYFIDEENGYIGLYVTDYKNSISFYLLLQYDGETLSEVARISMQTSYSEIVRACMADGYLYTVSDKSFVVTEL